MKYPSVILQSSEHVGVCWRDGCSNIPTETLKALFLESRLATSSIEAELQRRGSHNLPKARVDTCMQSIRLLADSVSIRERLDDKAIPIAHDLRRLMTIVPSDRHLKVYQGFLNEVKMHCGPEYTLLCAIGLGKHKISNLRADERVSLLALLKQEKSALSSRTLSSLALEYGIRSPDGQGATMASKRSWDKANDGTLRTLLQEDRYLVFEFMRRTKVDLLPSVFRSGMTTSKLWLDEEKQGGLAVTNCLSVCLPKKTYEDAFFIARISYDCGFGLANMFGLGDPIDSVPENIDINTEE